MDRCKCLIHLFKAKKVEYVYRKHFLKFAINCSKIQKQPLYTGSRVSRRERKSKRTTTCYACFQLNECNDNANKVRKLKSFTEGSQSDTHIEKWLIIFLRVKVKQRISATMLNRKQQWGFSSLQTSSRNQRGTTHYHNHSRPTWLGRIQDTYPMYTSLPLFGLCRDGSYI